MNKNEFEWIEPCLTNTRTADGVMFTVLDRYRFNSALLEQLHPVAESIGLILIDKGELAVRTDLIDLTATARANNLLTIVTAEVFYSLRPSDDFKGYAVFIDHEFMHNNMGSIGLRPKFGVGDHPLPAYTVSEQERQAMLADMEQIERNFERDTHLCFAQKVKLSVLSLVCDLIDVISKHSPLTDFEHQSSGRRDFLFKHFLELLNENVRSHHDVAFYADCLCITPQYLTKITKKMFRLSASRMIDTCLMREATLMLRTTELSVSQIADRLSFADSASFSKFFSKRQGCSPARYRRQQ